MGAVCGVVGRFKAVLLCGRVGVGLARFRALWGVLCGVGVCPRGDLRQPPSREGVRRIFPKKKKRLLDKKTLDKKTL